MNGTAGRRLATGAAVLSLVLAAGAALAGPAGRLGRAGTHGGETRGALRALDLTAEQEARLKVLLEEERGRREALRREAWDARRALRSAAESASPDPGEVGRAYLRVRSNRKAALETREASRSRLEAILTDEQKAKLEAWRVERGPRNGRELRGERRDRRAPRPPAD